MNYHWTLHHEFPFIPIQTHKQNKRPFVFLKTHRRHCSENQKPTKNTGCGYRQIHANLLWFTFFYSESVFSRTPFWILMLSLFLPLSVSLALPVFRGTWRDIRQGSETDCNSSVHFSAASSEPGSIRWPSWALRSSESLHRCNLPALLTGTLGGEEPDVWMWGDSGVDMWETKRRPLFPMKLWCLRGCCSSLMDYIQLLKAPGNSSSPACWLMPLV